MRKQSTGKVKKQSEAVFSKCNSTRIAFVEWHIPTVSSSSRMRGSRDTDSSQRSITLVGLERFNKLLTPSGDCYAWIPAFARKTGGENVFHYELDISGLVEMDCRAQRTMTKSKKTRHCEEQRSAAIHLTLAFGEVLNG